jgi:hypothetical protein
MPIFRVPVIVTYEDVAFIEAQTEDQAIEIAESFNFCADDCVRWDTDDSPIIDPDTNSIEEEEYFEQPFHTYE